MPEIINLTAPQQRRVLLLSWISRKHTAICSPFNILKEKVERTPHTNPKELRNAARVELEKNSLKLNKKGPDSK